MSDFSKFLDQLKDNLGALATEHAGEALDAFKSDSQEFLDEAKADLEDWTRKLAAGEMSAAGFELAVRGKAEVAKMRALTEAGLAAVRIDKIKVAILDTVISTAKVAFLG